MKILSSKFSKENFYKYQEIIQKISLSEYKSYIKKTEYIQNWEQFKNLISLLRNSQSKNTSISYRYVEDKYFMIVFYVDGNVFVISDEYFNDKTLLTKAIIKLITSKRNQKYFIWNLRHFLLPIINKLTPEQKNEVSNCFNDVQIIDHLVNLDKNPSLSSKYVEDENDRKVKVFIEKVHKDQSFYYYIPRHIMTNVLIKEAVVVSMMGQIFGYVATKLEQVEILKQLQKLSIVLCDIEKNNIMTYDPEKVMKLKLDNSFHKRLFDYVMTTNSSSIPLEYKFLNSSTGRLSFKNKVKLNMMAIPKTEVRETFIPENDIFISIDMSGMEIFYCLKTYSDFLDDVTIDSKLDVYQLILDKLDGNYKRSVIKNILIKMTYGASKFEENEIDAALEIKNKIPSLVIEHPKKLDDYIKTKKGRIIQIDKSVTKYLNNIIQSESSDLMIEFLLKIWNCFNEEKLKSKIKLLVHDQIVFDVLEEEKEQIKEIIERCCDFFPYKMKEGINLSQL